MKRDGSEAPTDVHAPLRITLSTERESAIMGCIENQFTSHDYSQFKSQHLRANITRTLQKVLIRSVITYLSRLVLSGKQLPLKIASPARQGSACHWELDKVHTRPRFAHGFQPSVRM
jgi:hypothetical protein